MCLLKYFFNIFVYIMLCEWFSLGFNDGFLNLYDDAHYFTMQMYTISVPSTPVHIALSSFSMVPVFFYLILGDIILSTPAPPPAPQERSFSSRTSIHPVYLLLDYIIKNNLFPSFAVEFISYSILQNKTCFITFALLSLDHWVGTSNNWRLVNFNGSS